MMPRAQLPEPFTSGADPQIRQMYGDRLSSLLQAGHESCVLLRLPAVLKARGRSRSSHYQDIKEGLFPRPVALGRHAVGWPDHEVTKVNSARIAGMDEGEIRALVIELELARKGMRAGR